MSKQSMFEGKNGIQQHSHITSRKSPNTAGFTSQKSLGSTTAPWNAQAGAPFQDAKKTDDGIIRSSRYVGDNPGNKYDRDEGPGVVVGKTDFAKPARMIDSPAGNSSAFPVKDMPGKANAIASATAGNTFPGSGVLGRT